MKIVVNSLGSSVTTSGLLKLAAPLDSTLRNVLDYAGTASPLFLSTTQVKLSGNSAVSLPRFLSSGIPFSGGSGTTTRPHYLFEPSSVTLPGTDWSTSGTFLGINAQAGFLGNYLDFKVNGDPIFTIRQTDGYKVYLEGGNTLYINAANTVMFPNNYNCFTGIANTNSGGTITFRDIGETTNGSMLFDSTAANSIFTWKGKIVTEVTLATAAPTGSSSGDWKLGVKSTLNALGLTAITELVNQVSIEIGGSTYYIPVSAANTPLT